MRSWIRNSFIFLFVFVLWNESFASELMTGAGQIRKNSFSGEVYYTKEESKLNLEAGTNVFFGDREGEKIVFKFDYGLKATFYPWIRFGANLQGYTLAIPSSTLTNYYRSNYPGWFLAAGGRFLLFPETVVNPAISFDFGYTYTQIPTDDFYLRTSELQGAVLVGKKFARFSPYCGFRVMPTVNELENRNNQGKTKGRNDNFSLFFGLGSKFLSRGKVFFEFALGDEQTFSFGISAELH